MAWKKKKTTFLSLHKAFRFCPKGICSADALCFCVTSPAIAIPAELRLKVWDLELSILEAR